MSVILCQELPNLLEKYKLNKPSSFLQFIYDEHPGSNSYFLFGYERIFITNKCYAKAWDLVLKHPSKIVSCNRGKVSAFLGICEINAYDQSFSHEFLLKKLNFSIEIANLLKV